MRARRSGGSPEVWWPCPVRGRQGSHFKMLLSHWVSGLFFDLKVVRLVSAVHSSGMAVPFGKFFAGLNSYHHRWRRGGTCRNSDLWRSGSIVASGGKDLGICSSFSRSWCIGAVGHF